MAFVKREDVDGGIVVKGCLNPVRLSGIVLKAVGLDVDEDAFERLAQTRQDDPTLEGFLVGSMEDVHRLCHIGRFVIWYKKGAIVPMGEEEAGALGPEEL